MYRRRRSGCQYGYMHIFYNHTRLDSRAVYSVVATQCVYNHGLQTMVVDMHAYNHDL